MTKFIKSAVIHKNTMEIRDHLDKLGYRFISRPSDNPYLLGGYMDLPEDKPNAYIVTDANYGTYHIALTKNDLPLIKTYVNCDDNVDMFLEIAALTETDNINDVIEKNKKKDSLSPYMDMTIGQLSIGYSSVVLVTLRELIDEQPNTVFSLDDFFDRRKSTCLTRFNYDPYTGQEIPWKTIKEELKKKIYE